MFFGAKAANCSSSSRAHSLFVTSSADDKHFDRFARTLLRIAEIRSSFWYEADVHEDVHNSNSMHNTTPECERGGSNKNYKKLWIFRFSIKISWTNDTVKH